MKQYVERRVQDANDNNRALQVSKICNEVTQRKSANKGILKADSSNERLLLWKSHFENLAPPTRSNISHSLTLNRVVNNELQISVEEFTQQELHKAIRNFPATKPLDPMTSLVKSGR